MAILAVAAVAGIALFALRCDHNWIAATCTDPEICGSCGKTRGQALGHAWKDANCTDPKTCPVCNETEGSALGHDWLDGSCTQPQVCAVCGYDTGDAPGHTWLDATCTDPKTCGVCGLTEGQALGHDFLYATCQNPETCRVCGVTQGERAEHIWTEPTCTAPKTCLICEIMEGEPLEHDWQDATCQTPRTCRGCGRTEGSVSSHVWAKSDCEQPKTCITCGKTSGTAIGHSWVDATCVTPKTCVNCGKASGTALGHDFAPSTDGETKTCNTCGETVKIKCVALTFDDGPSGSITRKLLEGLEALDARVTFFLCGYRIDSFPSYPQLILDYGHEIGLHTDNHATLTKLDYEGIYKELAGMLGQLPDGYPVRLMRPPGGSYNSTVKQVCLDIGLSIIMWSVDTKDWQTNNVDTIVERIVKNAKNGSIILMHDLKSSSVEAALKAIEILQSMGFEFVTVSELAAIQGKPLEPGKVYNSLS